MALTALAICTLSCRMAIISWRLYFMTGHWPVVKDATWPSPGRCGCESADLGGLVHCRRITGDVEAGNSERAAGARHRHERIEHGRRGFLPGIGALAVRLEADAIDRAVHLRNAEDLLDLVAGVALGQVDGLASEGPAPAPAAPCSCRRR